jgi:hypothetical protein
MNEPNSQHSEVTGQTEGNVLLRQDTETMLAKVQNLLRDAYASGYRAGYQKGFEFGVATVNSRADISNLDIQRLRGDNIQ